MRGFNFKRVFIPITLSLLIVGAVSGCERVDKEIELQRLNESIEERQATLDRLNINIDKARNTIEAEGLEVEPRYIVTIKVAQVHYTLGLSDHLKDSLNSTTFDIAVDKEYYNSVKIGDSVCKDFRTGSLLAKGSAGSWDLTISDKNIYQ